MYKITTMLQKFPPITRYSLLHIVFFFLAIMPCSSYAQTVIPFTSTPLTEQGDLSVKMVEGVNSFLLKEITLLQKQRADLWKRDFSSTAAYQKSITPQRAMLKHILGIAEERIAPDMEVLSNDQLKPLTIETAFCSISAVRWNAIEGLSAEGLLLTPKGKIVARIVMIPDADMQPEVLAGMQQPGVPGFGAALTLVKAGIEILIPALVSRDFKYSGNPSLGASTKQPHREWIYRQGYAVGRHVIGYELQKIFAAIDWFESRNAFEKNTTTVGVAGYGEGGLLALYAAAIDQRISTTLVSGYFDAREQLWKEPIYRNVCGLLKTFGDAELAAMVWPRSLVIEYSKAPEIIHANEDATPGLLTTPLLKSAYTEFVRAKEILPAPADQLTFVQHDKGSVLKAFSTISLTAFSQALHVQLPKNIQIPSAIITTNHWINNEKRQEHTVREMSSHVQHVLSICERTRNKDFWSKFKGNLSAQEKVREEERERFWQVLGKLPTPSDPLNVKARIYQQSEKWTSYEVTLDVFGSEVYAWGILIVPKDLKPGEKRAVVVCQHGLEGLPFDVVTTDTTAKNFHYYKGFATRLAEKGYITFAPHNPYRGEDKFRVIQRKANPLGLTLFSVIISQHQRIVEWLQQLSFVDPDKVAFYGLSYGGKTAMRVPAVVKGYMLSICSADFNEWVRKVSTTEHGFGYVYTGEYDMPEWDLGHTFNYAEMAALIAPRPFMVERGHFDGVGTDEWVNYEYGKVKRYYDLIGLEKAVRIEHFVGPHSINGKGTFEFLDTYLK
jgi:dienelactone hydrolase